MNMQKFKKKYLAKALLTGMLAATTSLNYASDVEVYNAATQGKASILLMFDTSGSMGISSLVLPKNNVYGSPGDVDSPLCELRKVGETNGYLIPEWQYNLVDTRDKVLVNGVLKDNPTRGKTSFYHEVKIGDEYIKYYKRGCSAGNETKYDRLSELKEAVITLLASNDLKNDVKIGLASFSSKTNLNVSLLDLKLVDGHSGSIRVPVAELTTAQRIKLAKAIAEFQSLDTTTNQDGTVNDELKLSTVNFSDRHGTLGFRRASSGTPSAHAYAEAAAYMMGGSTGIRSDFNTLLRVPKVYDGYTILRHPRRPDINENIYMICMGLARVSQSPSTIAFGAQRGGGENVVQCDNKWHTHDIVKVASNDTFTFTQAHIDYIPLFGRNYGREQRTHDGRTKEFIVANGAIVGEEVQMTIDGRVYTFPVILDPTKKQRLLLGKFNVNGRNYYLYQRTNIWQGYRDNELFLLPNEVSSPTEISDNTPVGAKRLPNGANLSKTSIDYFPNLTGVKYQYQGGPVLDSNGNQTRLQNGPIRNSEAEARLDVWDAWRRMPEGWRIGGWMKVNHEPMDIEPVVGEIHANGETGGAGLFVYRTNPLSLTGNATLSEDDYVGGMANSVPESKTADGSSYIAGGSANNCDGNGIYFLTDGAPNSSQDTMAQRMMNRTLGSFPISSKPTGGLVSPSLVSGLFSNNNLVETGAWEYIGEYAKRLNDKTRNPAGMQIKTAVVGLGASFDQTKSLGTVRDSAVCDTITNLDAKNACKWGSDEYGRGGFYYAGNADDIKRSILSFVAEVNTTIEPVSTGSPTIPADSFNPTQAPMVAYYGSFTPKPNDLTQLWLGNMNKYNIADSTIVGATDTAAKTALFGTDGKLNAGVKGLWGGGVLEKLKLQKTAGETEYARKIYTDRHATGLTNSNFENSATLQQVKEEILFGGNLDKDPNKNYWLNILGYDINVSETADKDNLPSTTLRQLGAVMHSSPLLLTQEGTLRVVLEQDDNGQYTGNRIIDSSNRKDYLLYGSTQGALHVIDNKTGEEKFAFVPNEMMRTQKEALLHEGKSTGGVKGLFYGIDAPWTAYTQYVVDPDNAEKLTVNHNNRRYDPANPSSLNTAGVQWVYGGLRMGGRSYYALDLTDIDTPKLRFHIDPANNKVYANGGSKTYTALQYMGQSWSKPTIARVKWRGTTKLVMFVGGGYDAGGTDGNGIFENGVRKEYAGYEQPNYNQENSRGGGVYMFDAINGDLLWWGSANVNSSTDATADPSLAETRHEDLKYSVVSQINAIDRDEDGLADHLYFGDLGGQAFRIDIDNRSTTTTSGGFVKRIERLFSEHKTDGSSPRFYEMPSMSAYNHLGKVRAVVAFNSGNRSSPLAGTNNTTNNTTETTTSAVDALYVTYDYNVTRTNLYTANAATENAWSKPTTWFDYNKREGVAFNEATTRGWKYTYSTTAGEMKGVNELETLGAFLYASVYEKDKNPDGSDSNTSSSCNAGVRGSSHTLRYCLPTGLCTTDLHGFSSENATENKPDATSSKSGLVTSTIGGKKMNSVGLVDSGLNKPNCQTNPSHIDCAETPLSGRINQLRWYESR